MEPQEEHNEADKGKRNMEKLFDLQVFAQENTQTTGGLSAEMKTYYGMAATKPLPTGGGKTVEWRKFGSFDKALTPLTEGVTPDGSGISVSYITKELAQYGDYTTVSDMLDLTAIDDVVLEITDRHGANMGLTLDTVTRNEIQQGKQVLYAPAIGADGRKTEVTARGALTAACRLTSEMVAKAATQLKKMNAPTFDGKYVCILHPSVAFDLRQDIVVIEPAHTLCHHRNTPNTNYYNVIIITNFKIVNREREGFGNYSAKCCGTAQAPAKVPGTDADGDGEALELHRPSLSKNRVWTGQSACHYVDLSGRLFSCDHRLSAGPGLTDGEPSCRMET